MKTKFTKLTLSILTLCLTTIYVSAQEEAAKTEKSPFLKADTEKMFTPIVALETWATYSMNESLNNAEDRADVMLRRFRFGAQGSPYSWLSYSFQLHLDRLGENSYASTKGKYAGYIDIWNAYITAKLLPKSELLNLHAGYFWSAVSREYNTSPWAVGSFDKTRANYYLRNFVTGTGNGIESGLALGGLKNFEKFGISYRVGAYCPAAYQSATTSSLLYSGRVMFSIGDPEQTKYSYMVNGNAWRKRNGITLGFGASSQADGKINDTLNFKKSTTYGADLLVDYKGIRVEGEYFLMKRSADGYAIKDFDGTEFHVRAGYNFIVGNYYLEPVFSYEKFEGEGANVLYSGFIGNDDSYDIGVNWYINKDKLRLALHYVIQEGEGISKLNTGDIIGLSLLFRL